MKLPAVVDKHGPAGRALRTAKNDPANWLLKSTHKVDLMFARGVDYSTSRWQVIEIRSSFGRCFRANDSDRKSATPNTRPRRRTGQRVTRRNCRSPALSHGRRSSQRLSRAQRESIRLRVQLLSYGSIGSCRVLVVCYDLLAPDNDGL